MSTPRPHVYLPRNLNIFEHDIYKPPTTTDSWIGQAAVVGRCRTPRPLTFCACDKYQLVW